MVVGDIHNIAEEVQKFDPHYFLKLNTDLGKYQIVERRSRKVQEGVLDGLPLCSFREVEEVVMTIDFINAEKEPPDMRILHELRKRDVWNYPGGPKAFYDDMIRNTEKRKQKREQDFSENVRLQAEERHKYIVREYDGMPDLKTIF